MNQEEKWLLEEKYGGTESEAFRADLRRLQSGEPLAYIIGHIPFLDTTIYLDSRPLIPRPETEYWVEEAIEFNRHKKALKILDLCAGSGAIGIAAAKALPQARVTFVELDDTHLATVDKNIKENLRQNLSINRKESEEKFKVIKSDLFSEVGIDEKFDLILSNPPYIDPDLDRAEVSVKSFEPHLALYGGEEGLELITRIVKESPDRLDPGGQLWIEHEPEQAAAIEWLSLAAGFTSCSTEKDQYGVKRYSVLVK